ncbi:MAG: CCA tRNA nucleotidyltransferase [Eubacteriales bacterium]
MEFIIPQDALFLLDRLGERGFDAYLVGGCVRDSLLGKMPKDFDICTSARPDQMLECFSDQRVIETGIKHGTVGVCLHQTVYEITTYRTDGNYTDHRHPDSVTFVNDLREDLARRDFTVNAMAYRPSTGVCDPFGGMDDLNHRLIRAVGEPVCRFEEDGLRILRGLRFSSVYDFSIEPSTADAIHRCKDLLSGIAVERIRVECDKLLCGAGVGRILREYSDVLSGFIPELLPFIDAHPDKFEAVIAAVEAVKPIPLLRWTTLFSGCFADSAAATADRIFRRLKFDRATWDESCLLIGRLTKPLPDDRIGVRTLICELGKSASEHYLEVCRGFAAVQSGHSTAKPDAIDAISEIREEILKNESCFGVKDLPITGEDLISLGCPKGPQIGKLLTSLFWNVIEEKIDCNRESLLDAAKSRIFL